MHNERLNTLFFTQQDEHVFALVDNIYYKDWLNYFLNSESEELE